MTGEHPTRGEFAGALAAADMVERSPGLAAIMYERAGQLKRGHDAEADAMLPLDALPRKAHDFILIAVDCIRATGDRRDLPRARRKLAQAGALLLAAIERLEGAAGTADGGTR